DEVLGLVQAGILSLDQVVAQAVVKTPFELQKAGANSPAHAAAPAAAPVPQAAPTAAAPRAAAPAAH
ncbi:MAG: hypothetical protein ACXVBE_07400, partial [Bdellovibrionota bacterium]